MKSWPISYSNDQNFRASTYFALIIPTPMAGMATMSRSTWMTTQSTHANQTRKSTSTAPTTIKIQLSQMTLTGQMFPAFDRLPINKIKYHLFIIFFIFLRNSQKQKLYSTSQVSISPSPNYLIKPKQLPLPRCLFLKVNFQ